MEGYDVPSPEFQTPPIELREAIFRHSGWRHQRQAVWESLKRTGASRHRLDRFANCGGACYVEVSPSTGDVRITGNFCHDRLCVPCGTARAHKISQALLTQLPEGPIRFLTLTLRHSDTPLRDQVDRLYRSFAVLRRRKWWLARVTGGAAFVEVKLSDKDGLWHPHLHVLIGGVWLDQKELSQEWHAVTGDSSIVKVLAVPDRKAATGYVAKYSAKPVEGEVYRHPEKLDECSLALKARRLCFTFQSWRGIDLDATPAHVDDWRPIGPLSRLFSDAEAGDDDARLIVEALLNHDKLPWFRDRAPPDVPNTSDTHVSAAQLSQL